MFATLTDLGFVVDFSTGLPTESFGVPSISVMASEINGQK
jgi:hypothetical protein